MPKTVCAEWLQWADVICVMEQKHKNRLMADFRRIIGNKPLHVLDIPDDYRYMDPALIALLEEIVPPVLGLASDATRRRILSVAVALSPESPQRA
jgi:predicted protein tyrosine phosphatase